MIRPIVLWLINAIGYQLEWYVLENIRTELYLPVIVKISKKDIVSDKAIYMQALRTGFISTTTG
jgi:hypothetical protein